LHGAAYAVSLALNSVSLKVAGMPADPPAPFHPTATRRVRETVRVGLGVILWTPSRGLLAGIRKGSHGAGSLALPGGHLDVGEDWEACARREVMEEMGIAIDGPLTLVHVTNDVFDANRHYVTIFLQGRVSDATMVRNMEEDKCEGWSEYTWDDLCEMARRDVDDAQVASVGDAVKGMSITESVRETPKKYNTPADSTADAKDDKNDNAQDTIYHRRSVDCDAADGTYNNDDNDEHLTDEEAADAVQATSDTSIYNTERKISLFLPLRHLVEANPPAIRAMLQGN
jgi:8-oxo-dGTP diphosphatase